jgi:ribonuclease J
VEIESEGRSVLVDAGIGLDEKPGTADRAAFNDWLEQTNVEGVVVSHGHPDHFGRLGGDCPRPVWIGRDAATLLEVAGRYTSIEPPRVDFHLVNSQQFEVGPFRVTPLMVDHSAFEAFTLLIEPR